MSISWLTETSQATLLSLASQASQNLQSRASEETTAEQTTNRWIGIGLAVSAGVIGGLAAVCRKLGLEKTNRDFPPERNDPFEYDGVERKKYWKVDIWWCSFIMMIVQEGMNAVAYALTDAIYVSPFGAISVVVTMIFASYKLPNQGKLSPYSIVGCSLCVIGSVVVVINAPQPSHGTLDLAKSAQYLTAPLFLGVAGFYILITLVFKLWVIPKWGKRYMIVHVLVSSLLGGLLVVCVSIIGGAFVSTAAGNKEQWKTLWFVFEHALIFAVPLVIFQMDHYSQALNSIHFKTPQVEATYYVMFAMSTIATSAFFYGAFAGTPLEISTSATGFLVVSGAIIPMQFEKNDDENRAAKLKEAKKVARRTKKPVETPEEESARSKRIKASIPPIAAVITIILSIAMQALAITQMVLKGAVAGLLIATVVLGVLAMCGGAAQVLFLRRPPKGGLPPPRKT